MVVDIPGIFYALFVAGGGIYGYVKAQSVISLVAGVGFGAAIALGSFLIYRNPRHFYLSLAASVLLAAVMGQRYYTSSKIMPAGLICMLSIAMTLWYSINGYLVMKKSEV